MPSFYPYKLGYIRLASPSDKGSTTF